MGIWTLTLILLTWRIWWAPNNASKWQMGFNSAFKGLSKKISAFWLKRWRWKQDLRSKLSYPLVMPQTVITWNVTEFNETPPWIPRPWSHKRTKYSTLPTIPARGFHVGCYLPQPLSVPDPPLPSHPPSYWLRLFLIQKFSRINTPTFSNLVILYNYPPTKMEQPQCSETSAYIIQTQGNYPEESIQQH
jgi:hypothetical protein